MCVSFFFTNFVPMKRLLIYIYALATLLLAGCNASRHRDMLAQLEELERQNVADSLMTNDSLAQALTEYFDRHGTPNEQLRAHYILGRTYADMGEAPAAIQAYLDAAECADTTAQDCDYAKLSRVYSQMSDVYYKQYLMQDYLHCLALSVRYAWVARDTLQALREYAFQAYAYNQFHQTDTALSIMEKACDLLLYHGWEQLAAGFSLLPVAILLDSGRIEKAKYYLHLYDTKSGHLDSDGNIEKGRELYYYYKGQSYALEQQFDSAEHYFRKELLFGKDHYNQNVASRGLAFLYKQLHQPDSAAKYALYSYDMMDSVYARLATKEVERTAALFRYTRHQEVAAKEHQKAANERTARIVFLLLFVLSLMSIGILVAVWQGRKKKAERRYLQMQRAYEQARRNLQELQSRESVQKRLIEEMEETTRWQEKELSALAKDNQKNSTLIKEKESVIKMKNQELEDLMAQKSDLAKRIEEETALMAQLQDELNSFLSNHHQTRKNEMATLAKSDYYRHLTEKASGVEKMSEEEWADTDRLVAETMPKFHAFISSWQSQLNVNEYRICLLLRLHIGQKESGTLLGISQSSASKICSSVVSKLFQTDGSGKELRKQLESIS